MMKYSSEKLHVILPLRAPCSQCPRKHPASPYYRMWGVPV